MIATLVNMLGRFVYLLFNRRDPEWFNDQIGDACTPRDTCPYCGDPINADDAVRTVNMAQPVEDRDYLVVMPSVLHEACARAHDRRRGAEQ